MSREKISFSFQCPKCKVNWGFNCIGALVDQTDNQQLTIHELTEILKDKPVNIHSHPDRFDIMPTKYLGDEWKTIHQQLKPYGAKWIKDNNDKTKSHWTTPKS